ncbi:MAG: glucosylglycerol hydrolase [Cyanobacteria bacterium P01_H01_bin.15]
MSSLQLVEKYTQELLDWAVEVDRSQATEFAKAQRLVRRLGAHCRPDGLVEIGFWTPELMGEMMRPRDIYLEVFTPVGKVDWNAPSQTINVRRDVLRLKKQGQFFWGVVSGLKIGTREDAGSFYWLRYFNHSGRLLTIRDLVPYSLPFGIFAPAEIYDFKRLQRDRKDLEYFRTTSQPGPDGEIPRMPAPVNILQIHVGTASPSGTLGGLTAVWRNLGHKLTAQEPLTQAEQNFLGYDAVQLLPIEPTIEYRDAHSPDSGVFATRESKRRNTTERLPPVNRLPLKTFKPNTQGWGYDVPIIGSSATSPALLSTQRPDELIGLIEVLHNFPTGPIQLIYDVVYGHADNQAELLINQQFFKGRNMYGQDLNHQLPYVRAILLEMQRRKINTGADGIRVDGAQDFRFFNPLTGIVEQDDAYLMAMADVVQEIGGCKRLLFTIFEDGRPWPEEGWEEKSTYRDLIEKRPESYQWGPLIFAHNTPALKGFWEKKWRRVQEVMSSGDRWITGCGNHDTFRRGNQVDLSLEINWELGEDFPSVIRNAYDNPSTNLWVYGFSPGLPMDFINVLMRAAWMFFRNTDDRYGVKVVSEEAGFLDWQVTETIFAQSWAFTAMKKLGFPDLKTLKVFAKGLQDSMISNEYDLELVVNDCRACLGDDTTACEISSLKVLNQPEMIPFLKELDIPRLKQFSLEFMEDCFEVCKINYYQDLLNPLQTEFNFQLRQFRHQHPWLGDNLGGRDRFNKVSENGTTVFYGLRANPEQPEEQVAMVTHMEGAPIEITLGDWLHLDLSEWEVKIMTPGLSKTLKTDDLRRFLLKQSQGLLLMPRGSLSA